MRIRGWCLENCLCVKAPCDQCNPGGPGASLTGCQRGDLTRAHSHHPNDRLRPGRSSERLGMGAGSATKALLVMLSPWTSNTESWV